MRSGERIERRLVILYISRSASPPPTNQSASWRSNHPALTCRQSWYVISLLYLSRLFYFILVTKYNLKKVLLLVTKYNLKKVLLLVTFELYFRKCNNKVPIFCDLFFSVIIFGNCWSMSFACHGAWWKFSQ